MTTDLKAMYKKVHKDAFPETMTILLGDEKLVYHKRVWTLDNEEKGLRYGENPDQPAALYELREGGITCGGLRWRGPGQGIVSAMTEAQMIQAGKHPGKTNLTDVDNGANILQYLSERPAAIILKHNNPCGAAWDDGGVAAALDKAFWCDRIAAFGGAVWSTVPSPARPPRWWPPATSKWWPLLPMKKAPWRSSRAARTCASWNCPAWAAWTN